MPEAPSQTTLSEPVSTRTKIIYGLGSGNDMWGNWFYVSFVWLFFNQYLGMSPALISTALSLRLLWDAITDPVFGWWSDNTRTRFGRRRPFILVGSILSGLFLPILFMVNVGASDTEYFWWMLITSIVFMTFVSCFNMPYNSLGAELSPDYSERNSIFKYKGSIQKVMEVASFGAGAFVTALNWENATASEIPQIVGNIFSTGFSWIGSLFANLATLDFAAAWAMLEKPFGLETGDGTENINIVLSARVYASMLGFAMICIGLILFFGLKERYYETVNKHQKKTKIVSSIWGALKCRPFRVQLSMGLAYSLGLSMVGTLGFYTTVYFVSGGNRTEGNLFNLKMGIVGMLFGFIGPMIWGLLASKFDKKRVILLIQFFGIAVFIATWWLYTPEIKMLQLLATGFIALTQAGFWMMYGSIGADVIDYDELESGVRREGAFSACGSYIMKIGMILGTFITGIALESTGFDAELGGDQPESAIFWIRFLLAAVPIAGLVISLLFIARFPLTADKMKDIRAQLEKRRGAV